MMSHSNITHMLVGVYEFLVTTDISLKSECECVHFWCECFYA